MNQGRHCQGVEREVPHGSRHGESLCLMTRVVHGTGLEGGKSPKEPLGWGLMLFSISLLEPVAKAGWLPRKLTLALRGCPPPLSGVQNGRPLCVCGQFCSARSDEPPFDSITVMLFLPFVSA